MEFAIGALCFGPARLSVRIGDYIERMLTGDDSNVAGCISVFPLHRTSAKAPAEGIEDW